jgi:hypothetical protein
MGSVRLRDLARHHLRTPAAHRARTRVAVRENGGTP